METFKGAVRKINKGPKAHSVQMSDGEWYGFGMHYDKELPFNEGALIQFTYEDAGKWKNVDRKTLEVLEASAEKAPQEKTSYKTKTTTRDSYWEDKATQDIKTQKEIRYHASRNGAVELVKVLIETGAISIGSQASKKLGVIEAAVDEYTKLFYAQALASQEGEYDVENTVAEAAIAEGEGFE